MEKSYEPMFEIKNGKVTASPKTIIFMAVSQGLAQGMNAVEIADLVSFHLSIAMIHEKTIVCSRSQSTDLLFSPDGTNKSDSGESKNDDTCELK